MKYGTIKHGKVKFALGSKQQKYLEWKGLPYSIVRAEDGHKRITRMNTGKDKK
jgi:hypothetical protein